MDPLLEQRASPTNTPANGSAAALPPPVVTASPVDLSPQNSHNSGTSSNGSAGAALEHYSSASPHAGRSGIARTQSTHSAPRTMTESPSYSQQPPPSSPGFSDQRSSTSASLRAMAEAGPIRMNSMPNDRSIGADPMPPNGPLSEDDRAADETNRRASVTTVGVDGSVMTRKRSIMILESGPSSRRESSVSSIGVAPIIVQAHLHQHAIIAGSTVIPAAPGGGGGNDSDGSLNRRASYHSGSGGVGTPPGSAPGTRVVSRRASSRESGLKSRLSITHVAGVAGGDLMDQVREVDDGGSNPSDDEGTDGARQQQQQPLLQQPIMVSPPSITGSIKRRMSAGPDLMSFSNSSGVGGASLLGPNSPLYPLLSANSMDGDGGGSSQMAVEHASDSVLPMPHSQPQRHQATGVPSGLRTQGFDSPATMSAEILPVVAPTSLPASASHLGISPLSAAAAGAAMGSPIGSGARSANALGTSPSPASGNSGKPGSSKQPPNPLLVNVLRKDNVIRSAAMIGTPLVSKMSSNSAGAASGSFNDDTYNPFSAAPLASPLPPSSPMAMTPTLSRLVGTFRNRTTSAASTASSTVSKQSYLTMAKQQNAADAAPSKLGSAPGQGKKGRRMSLGAALMMPPPPRVSEKMDLKTLASFTLGALGILYGDVATGPMFILKACFKDGITLDHIETDVLGILSFMIWITILLGVVKYCLVVLHADNNGEGGILALLSLVPQPDDDGCPPFLAQHYQKVFYIALCGCSFLLADGLVTPAISMLAALEGFRVLEDEYPSMFSVHVETWRIPVTCCLLLPLFYVQRFGLGRITKVFPVVMCIWFLAIAVGGVRNIIQAPWVLKAFNPGYMMDLMYLRGWNATLSLLSTVLLVASGLEFLYADLGAFKRKPIIISFSVICAPCILLSYLGQGAVLLTADTSNSDEFLHLIHNLFFKSFPTWASWPLVLLGMCVSAIGSQAVISGTFALIDQAVAIRIVPPIESVHIMGHGGTYYVPSFCFVLWAGSTVLVAVFQDSEVLVDMFGFCVAGAMVITSTLILIIMKVKWKFVTFKILPYGVIMLFDVLLFIASFIKIAKIGWITLIYSSAILGIMHIFVSTWNDINNALEQRFWTLQQVRQHIRANGRVKGCGVFVAYADEEVPHVLSVLAERLPALPEEIVLLTVQCMKGLPFVAEEDRVTVRAVDSYQGVYRVLLNFGFAERSADVVAAIGKAKKRGLKLKDDDMITYFVSRYSVCARRELPFWKRWQHKVYEVLSRNSNNQVSNLGLPIDKIE
ncbi:potassium transporter-domain-containing protein [Blastocladiella britannica]|nr:potassium transporter-domain-containing protein [Blastocladiella britannica]